MANLYDTSALKSFNEKDYINKMYDSYADSQKKLLEKNYTDSGAQLNTEKQSVQRQTDDYVKRTLVESIKGQGTYAGPKLSSGASAQARLVRDNARKANVTTLQGKQNDANMEIERQRKLLADQYSAAIKKATADNDMARAQDLYEAAKAEEEQLLGYRKSISSLLAQKGDTSVQDSLLKGETPSPDYTGETWAQVLKNEGSINEIYDKQLESERLGLQMEHDKSVSDLDAEQQKNRAETDRRLTEAYVDALKKNRNYQEVQSAYGQGSGMAAQARLARETELQKKLTDLRSVQLGTDADIGMQRYDLGQTYRDQLAKSQADISAKRIAALYEAAEKEEQALADTQQTIGQQLAKQNNYSVLGKLYGLTQDQIDRIQGTGRYAPQPVYYGGGGGSSYRYSGGGDDAESSVGTSHKTTPTTDIWYRGSQYSGVGAVAQRVAAANAAATQKAGDLMWKRHS